MRYAASTVFTTMPASTLSATLTTWTAAMCSLRRPGEPDADLFSTEVACSTVASQRASQVGQTVLWGFFAMRASTRRR